MNISDEDRKRIEAWAEKRSEIRAVYLYGSRARGDNRPDSDVDLAIQLYQEPSDTDTFTTWMFWKSEWDEDPDLHLSNTVHLEWYEKDAGLERVGPAVEKEGILLFCRD